MRNKRRRWDAAAEGDPLAGLVNLFDLWMVFSIALLLALVSYSHLPEHPSREAASQDTKSTTEQLQQQTHKLDRFRMSHDKLTGEGQRLGTAYRLKNGEVVYVPDQ